jgi:predicted transcriptional regulator
VGDDGLTDEERSRLKKVMKSFNFEVKPANKIIRMLSDPIKK